MKRKLIPAFLLALMAVGACFAQTSTVAISVTTLDGKKTTFTAADLKQLPRETASVTDPKTKAPVKYEGVLLSVVLGKAGAPSAKALHGRELRDYVVVKANDGYAVVFSLAELDQPTHANHVFLADSVDGHPLDEKQGPFKIVAPDDQRPERWVRMVTGLEILQAQ